MAQVTGGACGQPASPPARWRGGYVLANGIRIHYWRTGGDKPVMLLAHGFSDDGLCWTHFALELEADYDIIMADARGHGLSDPPCASDPPDAQCEDLAGMIRELELDRPILMGHSMGSASVAWLAARRPEVPRAVILEDPRLAPWPPGSAADVDRRRAQVLAQNNRALDELVADCLAKNPQWGRPECECWAPSKRRYHPNTVLARPTERPSMSDLLPKITAPTLILKADDDAETREQNEKVAALLKDGRLVHVDGAGHCVRRDRKEQSLKVLSEFLARV